MTALAGEKLTDAEIERFRSVFVLFDRNGDGKVSSEEFRDAMNELGFKLTDEQYRTGVACFDSNEDGSLDFEEFVELAKTFLI